MTTQPDLFLDICRNRHRGNRQSVEAHASIVANKENDFARIIAHLKEHGGKTCQELSNETGMPYTTCSGRLAQLKFFGKVYETGEFRPTASGRRAAVVEVMQ